MVSRPSLALLITTLTACATARGDDISGDAAAIDSPVPVDAGPDAAVGASSFILSEFVFNHAGLDSSEFIEVIGPTSTNAGNLTVVVIEGDSGAATGTMYFAEPLAATNADGLTATAFFSDGLQNGTQTVLLVTSLSATVGTDLDTDDDGTLDLEPWTAILDSVSVSDGDAGDLSYATPILLPDYDGGTLPVGGASRVPNTQNTGAASDWVRNDFDGEGLPCCAGAAAQSGEALNTPAATNQVAP